MMILPPHTLWYVCTCQSIIFWVSPDTVSRIFRCLPPHFYTVVHWAEPGPTVSSPTFCCLLHRALRMSGYETKMGLIPYFLTLFQSSLALLNLFPRIPMTLHHQVELFGPGPRWTFGLRAFGGIFFGFGSITFGQGLGKKRNPPFLSWKFVPLCRRIVQRASVPECGTLSLNLPQLIEEVRAIHDDQRMKSSVSQLEAKMSSKSWSSWSGACVHCLYAGMCIFLRKASLLSSESQTNWLKED